jgi:FKBP-type peptidyl-prolyl cis-trans isomerase
MEEEWMANAVCQRAPTIAGVLLIAVSTAMTAEPGPIDRGAPMAFTMTDSGLKYRILRKSDGAKPKITDKVTVHYRGWLDDETEFDSSYKRDSAATFPMNAVIGGWTEGLQLIGEGGMIELEIPPTLAYGERGAGGVIPPNATLHFLVELKGIDVEE